MQASKLLTEFEPTIDRLIAEQKTLKEIVNSSLNFGLIPTIWTEALLHRKYSHKHSDVSELQETARSAQALLNSEFDSQILDALESEEYERASEIIFPAEFKPRFFGSLLRAKQTRNNKQATLRSSGDSFKDGVKYIISEAATKLVLTRLTTANEAEKNQKTEDLKEQLAHRLVGRIAVVEAVMNSSRSSVSKRVVKRPEKYDFQDINVSQAESLMSEVDTILGLNEWIEQRRLQAYAIHSPNSLETGDHFKNFIGNNIRSDVLICSDDQDKIIPIQNKIRVTSKDYEKYDTSRVYLLGSQATAEFSKFSGKKFRRNGRLTEMWVEAYSGGITKQEMLASQVMQSAFASFDKRFSSALNAT